MINSWRMTTRLWQARMVEVLFRVCTFVVTCWAMTFVIIHQIFTSTWVASSFRAIRNVPTCLLAINNFLLESAVAVTVVVIIVIPSWRVVVNAHPVWTTHVSSAVILVEATCVHTLLAVSHAFRLELVTPTASAATGRQWLSESAVEGITKGARKLSGLGENQRGSVPPILGVLRHHHITTLHGLATFRVPVILSGGSTCEVEAMVSTGLSVDGVPTTARVRLNL
jgi:hypothetical protein